MDADSSLEPSGDEGDADADFLQYLACRLGVETREARERLSAWLNAYDVAPRSGVRRTALEPEMSSERQSA